MHFSHHLTSPYFFILFSLKDRFTFFNYVLKQLPGAHMYMETVEISPVHTGHNESSS